MRMICQMLLIVGLLAASTAVAPSKSPPPPALPRTWVPPSPAALAVQSAIDEAVRASRAVLVLPEGEVRFNDAALNVTGAHGLSIGGAATGTTLIFRPGVGVRVQNCTGTTLHSLAVDYSPLPYVHGAVVATPGGDDVRAPGSVTVRLDEQSLTFEELLAHYPPHDTWPPVTAYAKGTLDFKATVGQWGRAPVFTRLSPAADREYSLQSPEAHSLAEGDVVVAPTRTGFTVTLSWTANVTLRDVTLFAAGNMAITEFQGGGGNVYENVSLVPRGPSTPLASNADGFHSSGLRRGPTLHKVRMHNLLDDYFNVHNTFQLVAKRASPRSLLVGDFQYLAGDNTLYVRSAPRAPLVRGQLFVRGRF